MAAPKGNKFAVGNSGKAKKWDSAESLQADIEKYYAQCKKEETPLTIEGLAETLDCDRHTLLNYEKAKGYEEFFATIKKAKNKVARNKVERGLKGEANATMTIFDLKNNHGYKDQTQTDITSKGKTLSSSVVLPEGQTMDTVVKDVADLIKNKSSE